MIHRIEETTSTNDDARDAKYRHGDIVWAERQTAGRGQRGHKWSSAEGLNLTFSLVLEPRFLPAGEQFLLNEAVALALTDTFAQFGIAARIKWTNDIYAGDKKLVGILIEHSYSGQTLARTIVGIGINVNQTEFDPALPNPVSMAMVAGRTFDRGEVLEAFRRHIGIRYAQLELDERETLQRDYRERMYRLGERHTFRYPDGTPTEASIEGVRPTGELLLRHADGTLREYLFKEIEFVIEKNTVIYGRNLLNHYKHLIYRLQNSSFNPAKLISLNFKFQIRIKRNVRISLGDLAIERNFLKVHRTYSLHKFKLLTVLVNLPFHILFQILLQQRKDFRRQGQKFRNRIHDKCNFQRIAVGTDHIENSHGAMLIRAQRLDIRIQKRLAECQVFAPWLHATVYNRIFVFRLQFSTIFIAPVSFVTINIGCI